MNNGIYPRFSVFSFWLVATLLLSSGIAQADQLSPAIPQAQPKAQTQIAPTAQTANSILNRVVASATIGGGMIALEADQESGVSLGLYLGMKLNPNFAIGLDTHAVQFSVDESSIVKDVSLRLTTLTAHAFVSSKIWVKGGLGVGSLKVSGWQGESATADQGMGGMAGMGIALAKSDNLALELQIRAAVLVPEDNGILVMTAIGIGVSWN